MAETVPAVTAKVAVVEAAATVTEAGTDNTALLSERLTVEPPAGAACDRVIVQLEVLPEAIVAGEHCNAVTVTVPVGGLTVMEAVAEPPFSEAVTVTA